MSDLERADKIEAKVGAKRHPTEHIGRAVSVTERVYILHSQECFNSGIDLRDCAFSQALDLGIDMGVWESHQDVPVVLRISDEFYDLEPVREAEQ